jgi:hypothetical protein
MVSNFEGNGQYVHRGAKNSPKYLSVPNTENTANFPKGAACPLSGQKIGVVHEGYSIFAVVIEIESK